MCKFQTPSQSVCRGLALTIGWRHFISFSQLAATLTIAKIHKKVVYGAFFDRLKRK